MLAAPMADKPGRTRSDVDLVRLAQRRPGPRRAEHHFGTVRHEYTSDRKPVYDPKPAYLAAKTLSSTLAGFQLTSACGWGVTTIMRSFFAEEAGCALPSGPRHRYHKR